jgi:O-acetyl-ADP-ribose deacetylase (regulator of RNase III)
MIEFKTGDIFSIDTQAIVNTVNCVGVMGRGIALQFKKKYPDNFRAYEAKWGNWGRILIIYYFFSGSYSFSIR